MSNPFRNFAVIVHRGVLDVALEALGEVQLDGFAGLGHTILKKDATPQGSTAWRESVPPELSDGGTFPEGDAGKGSRPSRGLFNFGLAQIVPIDIRPQVFAADDSVRRPFNSRTMLCRNVVSAHPVIHDLRHAIDAFCQRGLRTDFVNCSLKCIHGRHIKHVFSECQHLGFDMLNISCSLNS
jgi:hypothetical protein